MRVRVWWVSVACISVEDWTGTLTTQHDNRILQTFGQTLAESLCTLNLTCVSVSK